MGEIGSRYPAHVYVKILWTNWVGSYKIEQGIEAFGII